MAVVETLKQSINFTSLTIYFTTYIVDYNINKPSTKTPDFNKFL